VIRELIFNLVVLGEYSAVDYPRRSFPKHNKYLGWLLQATASQTRKTYYVLLHKTPLILLIFGIKAKFLVVGFYRMDWEDNVFLPLGSPSRS